MHKSLKGAITFGILSASLCSASFAATVVERHDIQGKKEVITLENKQVHIGGEDPNYYSVMDLNEQKVYLVDGYKKRIVEMDIEGKPPELPEGKKPPWFNQPQQPVTAHLKYDYKKAARIAGYDSHYYQLQVYFQKQWRPCFENYFSQKAAKVPYLVDFLEAISVISKSRRLKGMPVHPCFQALDNKADQLKKLGVPMKTVIKVNKADKVKHEILSIKRGVSVSSVLFKLPDDYERISEAQKREEDYKVMMKKMQEAQKEHHRPAFK
jgi:hypothetical protein